MKKITSLTYFIWRQRDALQYLLYIEAKSKGEQVFSDKNQRVCSARDFLICVSRDSNPTF